MPQTARNCSMETSFNKYYEGLMTTVQAKRKTRALTPITCVNIDIAKGFKSRSITSK